MDSPQLIQQLVESFTALADEVQNLTDRKTILEHKLRYAHEQYQALADKYAPCAPDIAETIAKLQIPPTPTSATFVPLPSRLHSDSSQAQLALFIRDGKKVAQQLQVMAKAHASKASASSGETVSTKMTSELLTVLEKDFTVEGKKGQLQCPFSAMKNDNTDGVGDGVGDPTPHHSSDPICAAMCEETTSAAAPNGAPKCPIRFMDKHSPEEIAHYVETHKHELPRSHEVCLRRNQKNEEQIRKLDSKYGNLVSMIQDLSHLHAPMLPSAEANIEVDLDRVSNRRVSDWAQNVSASVVDGLTGTEDIRDGETLAHDSDLDRTSHFNRPLKEVRVGESPSRPWGISVPIPLPDGPVERPVSPPAPVRMPSPARVPIPKAPAARTGKCPFDHTKMRLDGPGLSEFPKMEEPQGLPRLSAEKEAASQPFTTPLKPPQPMPPDSPPPSHQPAFITMAGAGTGTSKGGAAGASMPQMVFNGPVFIGYPMEQAIQFMQQFQNQQQR